MAQNPYSQLHQGGSFNQAYKSYDDWGRITPNFEFSEGIRPAGEFQVAPYLPSVRFNVYFKHDFVVSAGKVVAMDEQGSIVPAGLGKQAAAVIANGGADKAAKLTAVADQLTKYSSEDVQKGVRNAAGALATDGEAVVASMINAAGTAYETGFGISAPVGVASYNYWRHAGGNGENPALFNEYNFSLQNKVAFLCDYQIELPIVSTKAVYDAAPFKGMGAMIAVSEAPVAPTVLVDSATVVTGAFIKFFIKDAVTSVVSTYHATVTTGFTAPGDYTTKGLLAADLAKVAVLSDADLADKMNTATTAAKPGDFVTFDVDSNFVVDAQRSHETLGQVLSLDMRQVRDYLDKVRTRGAGFGTLEQMPGTATAGKSDTLTYSGGVGLVRINLQNR